jgi:hypothetical protein
MLSHRPGMRLPDCFLVQAAVKNFWHFAGTKSLRHYWYSPVLAKTARLAASFILVANRGCVLMLAPPLSLPVGFHPVSVCCRPGRRQMFPRFFRQLLIF